MPSTSIIGRADNSGMEPRASYLVGRLDRLLRRQLGDALVPHRLTLAEYTALSVLASRDGLSNAQLARRTLITPQSMNEVLARLVEARLVRRSRDPLHRRVLRAELTDEGRERLAAADAVVVEVERRMLAGLAGDDRQRLLASLAACVRGLTGPAEN
jgi:DNA-binding MarR family transcriptional regulator